MTTILDLPEEVYILIAKNLRRKALYSCIRVCRVFYASFIPSLWSGLMVMPYKRKAIDITSIRANAHHVETVYYSATGTEDYYTITFPRLRAIVLLTYYGDEKRPNYLAVQPSQKVQFARLHPTVRKLVYNQKDRLPKEFWEAVETEWKEFESLGISGGIEPEAADAFWRVCGRVQYLHLSGMDLPDESLPILSTLSFERLRTLTVKKYSWERDVPHRMWPLQLLEQCKKSAARLRRLDWAVHKIPFPVQLVIEALQEGCWPELCELVIGDPKCYDQDLAKVDEDLAKVLRTLTSGRLTYFQLAVYGFGYLTYKSIKELYFTHLRELDLGKCVHVSSAMVQEILVECVNLETLDAPHIIVWDIAMASKPWGCLRLQKLVVFIAKRSGDEDEWGGKVSWDGLVFEQISRLRHLRALDLRRDPYLSIINATSRPKEILDLETLDFRLAQSKSRDSDHVADDNDGDDGVGGRDGDGSDISCWSSLVQLREFGFDGDRQMLGMDEARWMVEHWRDLWFIRGDFKAVEGDDESNRLNSLFRHKGIEHF
ncbi:hypothetical protein BGX29_011550 [Mortierella sp. GBA35]|nr:hypothetical protein BGX29_011550 [Mortierella sp. GBA35]